MIIQQTKIMRYVSLTANLAILRTQRAYYLLCSAFAEDDEITELEFSTDDWWTGTVHGNRGLWVLILAFSLGRVADAREKKCIGSLLITSRSLNERPGKE